MIFHITFNAILVGCFDKFIIDTINTTHSFSINEIRYLVTIVQKFTYWMYRWRNVTTKIQT